MPWEVLTGFATAPSSTLTALTMGSGDSLTVRKSEKPKLMAPWVDIQTTAGALRIRSVLMHDAVQGLRLQGAVDELKPLLPIGLFQPLQPQDALTVEISGSAVAGDIETAVLPIHYDVLPGTEGRFIDEATLRGRAVQPFAVENTLALGTAGGYSGSEAINAEFDNYKAETDYALCGFINGANEAALISIRGPDLGNLRVGNPGELGDQEVYASWMIDYTRGYGIALIPVINAANKAATNLDGAQDENGGDPTVSHIYMQLTPEAAKQAAAQTTPSSRAPTPAPRLGIGVRTPATTLLGR